mgnify:CR=1 FL=1
MEDLVVAWVLCMLALILGIFFVRKAGNSNEAFVAGLFLICLSLLSITTITFVDIPIKMPSGLPKTSIDSGTYKVAFVYIAGENVNVGIYNKENEKERLYLYQFSISSFDGNALKTDGKELLVVGSGGFKRLVMK